MELNKQRNQWPEAADCRNNWGPASDIGVASKKETSNQIEHSINFNEMCLDKAFADEPGCRTSVEQVEYHFKIRFTPQYAVDTIIVELV